METARTAYFSALDTVHFRSELPESVRDRRMVGATGAVMLQMLLSDVTPVLSQTQAFDGAVVVNTLGRLDDDCVTLLEMARSGRVRVPILDGPLLRSDPADGERFTLLNAFTSALRRPDFRFSAWPEFNADPDLREAVAEQLDRDPGRVQRTAGRTLHDRLHGLVEFDRALRDSAGPGPVRLPEGPGLCARILSGLEQARRGRPEPEAATLARIEARVRLADRVVYDRRSAWYALLDEYGEVFGEEARGPLEITRGIVDAHYNQIVAASLGADGIDMEVGDFETAQAVARAGVECHLGARTTQLVSDPSFGEWLTWSRLTETMAKMRHLTLPQSRFAYLVGRYREHAVPRRAEQITGKQVWAHVSAAPANMFGTAVGGIVGLVLGGDMGALLGSQVGSLGGIYANYVLDRRKDRAFSRAEAKARGEFDGHFTPVLTGGSLAYHLDHDA